MRLDTQQGWSCYGTVKYSPGEVHIHFHMLFLDGVYADGANGSTRFRWLRAPSASKLAKLAHQIAHRVGRFLERQCALPVQDAVPQRITVDLLDTADWLLHAARLYRADK